MASEPEQLEREIADTREQLGRNVDALAEKVSPSAAARRGVDRVKAAATSIRENVMGSTSDAAGSAGEKAAALSHSVGDTATSAKESVADAGRAAKRTLRRNTTGNPFAAGVIAFGVGWLASSLIPASRTEEQLGQAVRKTAKEQGGTVREELGSAASEVAENLREPAKDAAAQVRETAVDAAATVKDETTDRTADLADEAKRAGQSVREGAEPGRSAG